MSRTTDFGIQISPRLLGTIHSSFIIVSLPLTANSKRRKAPAQSGLASRGFGNEHDFALTCLKLNKFRTKFVYLADASSGTFILNEQRQTGTINSRSCLYDFGARSF